MPSIAVTNGPSIRADLGRVLGAGRGDDHAPVLGDFAQHVVAAAARPRRPCRPCVAQRVVVGGGVEREFVCEVVGEVIDLGTVRALVVQEEAERQLET